MKVDFGLARSVSRPFRLAFTRVAQPACRHLAGRNRPVRPAPVIRAPRGLPASRGPSPRDVSVGAGREEQQVHEPGTHPELRQPVQTRQAIGRLVQRAAPSLGVLGDPQAGVGSPREPVRSERARQIRVSPDTLGHRVPGGSSSLLRGLRPGAPREDGRPRRGRPHRPSARPEGMQVRRVLLEANALEESSVLILAVAVRLRAVRRSPIRSGALTSSGRRQADRFALSLCATSTRGWDSRAGCWPANAPVVERR
jgi:hypothetical protein